MKTYIPASRTSRTSIVWQTSEVLLVEHNVCRFGHHKNMCLTNILGLWKQKVFFKSFKDLDKKMGLSSIVCRGGQTHQACLTSKIRNILSSNPCMFNWGLGWFWRNILLSTFCSRKSSALEALPYWVTLGMCGQNGWVFEAQKSVDGCKCLPKTLRMGHNFNTQDL